MRYVTNVKMGNAAYPSLQVIWNHNEEQTSWFGDCTIWKDANTKGCDKHEIWISQGTPLGSIGIYLDDHDYGCWGYATFPGYGVTEKDLFWATVWAVQSIERKHQAFGECNDNMELNSNKKSAV